MAQRPRFGLILFFKSVWSSAFVLFERFYRPIFYPSIFFVQFGHDPVINIVIHFIEFLFQCSCFRLLVLLRWRLTVPIVSRPISLFRALCGVIPLFRANCGVLSVPHRCLNFPLQIIYFYVKGQPKITQTTISQFREI